MYCAFHSEQLSKTDDLWKTCNNFASLADRNYYNNTIFHRIIPDFMIQGGYVFLP